MVPKFGRALCLTGLVALANAGCGEEQQNTASSDAKQADVPSVPEKVLPSSYQIKLAKFKSDNGIDPNQKVQCHGAIMMKIKTDLDSRDGNIKLYQVLNFVTEQECIIANGSTQSTSLSCKSLSPKHKAEGTLYWNAKNFCSSKQAVPELK